MKIRKLFILLVAVAACDKEASPVSVDPGGAYEAVLKGTKCSMGEVAETQVDCHYSVGRGLEFDIAGVGRDDAAITVNHADGLDADYYMTFGLLHGCVIVKGNIAASLKAGLAFDMAFVSPKDGKVYRTWRECNAAG